MHKNSDYLEQKTPDLYVAYKTSQDICQTSVTPITGEWAGSVGLK